MTATEIEGTVLEVTSPLGGLFTKLAAVTAEIGSVQARGKNKFLNTSYITEEDMLNAVREKLTDRNVIVLPSLVSITERPAKTSKGKDTTVSTATFRFTFCDGDTGETFTREWAGSGEDQTDKGLVKAETQALRTFLLKAFLVAAGDPQASGGNVPPVRSDGQAPITEEQYNGLLDAWKRAGSNLDVLHQLLDGFDIPRKDDAGEDLSPDGRVCLLTAAAALAATKKLVAKEVPAR